MTRAWIAFGLAFALICGSANAQIRFRGDAWRDFIGGARLASSPGYGGSLGPNKDQKLSQVAAARGDCMASVSRTLPADARSPNPLLTIGYNASCNNEGAISISVWEPTDENQHIGRNEWTLSAADVGVDTMGPVQGVTIQASMAKVELALEKAISLDPFPASKLPPWPQGGVVPTLAAGLIWREGAERELYEAVRAGNYQVYCIFAWQITCAADVPARPGQMVHMLKVGNLSELYQPADAKAALAVLNGERAQLTPNELEAARTRVSARNRAIFESMRAIAQKASK